MQEKLVPQLLELLENHSLLKKDTKNLKYGEMVMLIPTNYELYSNKEILIGTIERVTDKEILVKDSIEAIDDVELGITKSKDKCVTHNIKYYKIKKPEPVKRIMNSHYFTFPSIFKNIQKEIEETPEHEFVTMNQQLPAELQEMQPEKKLRLYKNLERLLEKKMEIKNVKMANWCTGFIKYAKLCGVNTEEAQKRIIQQLNEIEQEKRKQIKEIRKIKDQIV